jgi:polysaccharide export outer membrane protein
MQVLIIFAFIFAEVGCAQIGIQQSVGSKSGTATNQSRAGGVSHGSGLSTVPTDFSQLKLAPGFLLSLNVLDDADFAGDFRVDEHGDLTLPILGTFHVAGETTPEARVQIMGLLLERKILKDPQVELSVVEYSAPEVTILGEVATPGKYPLPAPRKLVDVLMLAGGVTGAAGNEVTITRGNSDAEPLLVYYSRSTNIRTVAETVVYPGDTVQVKRAGIVYVLGAVTHSGGYVMQEDGTLTVLQAISLANGTSMPASTGTIHLLRRNADGTEVDIALPFNKMRHGKSADVQLHAMDILYVPTSRIKSILSYSQAIMTAAAVDTVYVGIEH